MKVLALAVLLGTLTYQHPFAFLVTALVVSVVAGCDYLERDPK